MPIESFAQVAAFPTAEGFGSDTTHGRGGAICEVTRLDDDSNAGSLRYCTQVQTGPRIIIFKTGGTIELDTDLYVNSNAYIAGQTAPGGGVQIRNFPLVLENGVTDIVIRHMRIRMGVARLADANTYPPNLGPDSLMLGNHISPPSNIVIDHSSIQWGPDENVQCIGCSNTTIQWSIIAEGGPISAVGASAGLLGSDQLLGSTIPMTMSLHHNLFAHNQIRNPIFSFFRGSPSPVAVVDIRNNIMYNWGGDGFAVQVVPYDADGQGGTTGNVTPSNQPQANVINNFFKPGPSGAGSQDNTVQPYGPSLFYLSGNWGPLCPSGCGGSEWDITGPFNQPGGDPVNVDVQTSGTEISVPSVTTTPTSQVFDAVLDNVGAIKPARDSLDARIVQETRDTTGVTGAGADGNTTNYPTLAIGTPYTDTDGDGISDSWETACGLNPNDASDGDDLAPNGYTNVENFINEMAGDTLPGGECGGLTVDPDVTAPTVPSTLVATTFSAFQINLSWGASTDEEGGSGLSHYEIERCKGAACITWVEIATVLAGTTTYSDTDNDTGLEYDTLYRYRVRAVDVATNESAYSNIDEATTSDIDISDFLVAHYLFDGNANDATAGAHHASNVGTPTYVDGQLGQAISFNGTSSALSVPHAADLSIASDMTISTWLYMNVLPSIDGYQVLVSKDDASGSNAPYGINLLNIGGITNFAWFHHTDGQTLLATPMFTDYVIPISEWKHYVFVRDISSKTVSLYVDGILTSTMVWTDNNPAVTTSGPLTIGYHPIGNDGFLNGMVDDLRIYSVALDDVDAASLNVSESVMFSGSPTALSVTASGTVTFPGSPSAISATASTTPSFGSNPASLSATASGTVTFAGPPTNLGAE